MNVLDWGPEYPNETTTGAEWLAVEHCGTGCLFNLSSDPGERHDIAANEPARLAEMRRLAQAANRTVLRVDRGKDDPAACERAWERGGTWGPWVGKSDDDIMAAADAWRQAGGVRPG